MMHIEPTLANRCALKGPKVLNFDPRKPFYRTLFLIIGATIIGIGVAPLRHGDLSYENWWGGLGFAPFAIVFGIIIVLGALFKPSIFGRQPSKTNKKMNLRQHNDSSRGTSDK